MEKNEDVLKKYESIKSLYDGFVSGEDSFPVEECRNQNDGVEDVFYGENYYYIIVCDIRFDGYAYIMKAKPYIRINENSEKSYGWKDDNGYEISCAFNPDSNLVDEYVCAWMIAE